MVDAWFGKLIDTLDRLGRAGDTLVVFVSDHGTNFAENSERLMGKPHRGLYPGTMDLPLLLRHPEGCGAASVCDEFVYPHDVTATVFAATGAEPPGRARGAEPLPLAEGGGGFQSRDYLACRHENSVWYKDRKSWFFSSVRFERPRLFDLEADPACQQNIAERAPDRIALATERILADARGELTLYERQSATDALGRPAFVRG